jgi:hypothetical protein
VHITFSQFDAVAAQPIPSYKAITRWLTQIGLYKLQCEQEQADDWALIADNSIQLGTQKCLVVLGIRLSQFQKGKALTLEDVKPLVIELHNKSDAGTVCRALEKAQEKVGEVVMTCTDDGPDLRSGVKMFCQKYGVGRVLDIIHKIGTFLKKILEKDAEWQAFAGAASEAKKKMQQTEAAHLAPPNQRTKSRFLNIDILVRWSVDVMVAMETPGHPDKKLFEQHCGWIHKHKALLERLKQFDFISQKTRQYIRENGICFRTGDLVDSMLETEMASLEFNMEACEYAGQLVDFLREQSRIVPFGQVWIGTSEIIETLFGKMKSLEQDQSKGGFTSLVLGVAACAGKIDADLVREAMKQVKSADVDAWIKEQMGPTILAKRRQALGGWRKNKAIENVVQEPAGIYIEASMGF